MESESVVFGEAACSTKMRKDPAHWTPIPRWVVRFLLTKKGWKGGRRNGGREEGKERERRRRRRN